MARCSLLIASLLCLPLVATAAGFDADAEGWTTSNGVQVWKASGGNGGGWLEISDLDGNTDVLIHAPAAWLGNWSAYLGGTLSFDAKNDGVSIDWPRFGTVAISGPGGTVNIDFIAADQPPLDNQWRRYSVTLAPAAGWTGASLSAVLANVTSLTINGEYHAGPGELLGIDNLQVTAVPEPASAALLLGGLGLLAGWRRKR